MEELELLAPFGEGNPEPSFRTDGMLLRGLRRIGSSGNHIKWSNQSYFHLDWIFKSDFEILGQGVGAGAGSDA